MAQPQPASCPRGLLSDSAETTQMAPIATARQFCQKPAELVSGLKSLITEYMCLFFVDANCLTRIAELKAIHGTSNTQSTFNMDYLSAFQQRIGPRIIDQWLDAPATLPAMRFASSINETEESDINAMTTVGLTVVSFVPAGNYVTAAANVLISLGRREDTPVDPLNDCGDARDIYYINAFARSDGCYPDLLFQSRPVSNFLKQPLTAQTQALQCDQTCQFYTSLLQALGRANASLYRSQLPILSSSPRCENGAAVFSFDALNPDTIGLGDTNPGVPVDWRGIVPRNSNLGIQQSYHLKNNIPLSRQASWRTFNVRSNLSDLHMGNIRAEVLPTMNHEREINLQYRYRPNTFETLRQESGRAPVGSRFGTTYPTRSGGNSTGVPGRTHPTLTYGPIGSPISFTTYRAPSRASDAETSYQDETNIFGRGRDPAMRGLAMASSIASACCRVTGEARTRCMQQLPTVSQFPVATPPVNEPAEIAQ